MDLMTAAFIITNLFMFRRRLLLPQLRHHRLLPRLGHHRRLQLRLHHHRRRKSEKGCRRWLINREQKNGDNAGIKEQGI